MPATDDRFATDAELNALNADMVRKQDAFRRLRTALEQSGEDHRTDSTAQAAWRDVQAAAQAYMKRLRYLQGQPPVSTLSDITNVNKPPMPTGLPAQAPFESFPEGLPTAQPAPAPPIGALPAEQPEERRAYGPTAASWGAPAPRPEPPPIGTVAGEAPIDPERSARTYGPTAESWGGKPVTAGAPSTGQPDFMARNDALLAQAEPDGFPPAFGNALDATIERLKQERSAIADRYANFKKQIMAQVQDPAEGSRAEAALNSSMQARLAEFDKKIAVVEKQKQQGVKDTQQAQKVVDGVKSRTGAELPDVGHLADGASQGGSIVDFARKRLDQAHKSIDESFDRQLKAMKANVISALRTTGTSTTPVQAKSMRFKYDLAKRKLELQRTQAHAQVNQVYGGELQSAMEREQQRADRMAAEQAKEQAKVQAKVQAEQALAGPMQSILGANSIEELSAAMQSMPPAAMMDEGVRSAITSRRLVLHEARALSEDVAKKGAEKAYTDWRGPMEQAFGAIAMKGRKLHEANQPVKGVETELTGELNKQLATIGASGLPMDVQQAMYTAAYQAASKASQALEPPDKEKLTPRGQAALTDAMRQTSRGKGGEQVTVAYDVTDPEQVKVVIARLVQAAVADTTLMPEIERMIRFLFAQRLKPELTDAYLGEQAGLLAKFNFMLEQATADIKKGAQ